MALTQLYDSTCPWTIPDRARAVMPYMDGLYRWDATQLARFRSVPVFPITVEDDPAACVFDLEPGCCTIEGVANAINTRRREGKASIVYCSESPWQDNFNGFYAAGLRYGGPPTFWLIAAYIVGPNAPLEDEPPMPTALPTLGKRLKAVGRQYFSGPNVDGYDISAVDLPAFPWNLF